VLPAPRVPDGLTITLSSEKSASELASSKKALSTTHQTLKNRTLLENYYLPGGFEATIDAFSSITTVIAAITRA